MMRAQSMQDYKRLAGLGSHYDSWTRPSLLGEGASAPDVSLQGARISRMAHLLEDERMGGSLSLPQFDPQDIERLMEAAVSSPRAQAAAQHHMRAMAAHKHAHAVSGDSDHKASHAAHSQAAEMHRTAAKHAAASGNVRMAQAHDAFARHHDQHAAAHARQLGGINNTAHKPDASPEAPAPGKKAGLIGKLKAKLQNIGGGGVNWSKEAEKTAPKPQVQKDPFPSKKAAAAKPVIHSISKMKKAAPKKTEPEMHSGRAQQATRVAGHLQGDQTASHKELAHAHHDASHEHLHAALSSFHSGDHAKALAHFNAAIHHMNKHKAHSDAVGAHAAHAERSKAGGGSRAAAGMTRVPRA